VLVWDNAAWVAPNSQTANPSGLELITGVGCSSGGTASNGVVTIGSAVSMVTVTNAFSADYDNYKIIISGGASTNSTNISLRLGSSTSTYYGTFLHANYTTTTPLAASMNNALSVTWAGGANVNYVNMNVDLQNPFLAKMTMIQAHTIIYGSLYGHTIADHETASSYTSFSIFPATGTITGGTIRVYGYRD
jgi:hypothetical protein